MDDSCDKKTCALCGRPVCTEDDYCHGCRNYVCQDCCTSSPWGTHHVTKHLDQEDDDAR